MVASKLRSLLCSFTLLTVAAAPALAQAQGNSADPAKSEANGDSQLDINFAEAVVKLAQIDLQQAVDFNNRLSGAVSSAEVERLQNNVTSAQQYVDMLKKADGKPGDKLMMSAEWSLKNAENNYQRARAVNARAAGTIDKNQIEKLKLIVDLNRASVDKAKAAAASDSPMAVLQCQLDLLQFEMLQLRGKIESIISRR